MIDPLFWLGVSIFLVAVSLTAVLVAVVPAVKELARAARSAEKLFDTLSRELPPTLESIRLTGMEISDLTDDVSQGVQQASHVAKQIDQSLETAREGAKGVQMTTRSLVTGVRAGWRHLVRSKKLPPQSKGESLMSSPYPSNSLSDGQPYEPNARRRASRPPRLPAAEESTPKQ